MKRSSFFVLITILFLTSCRQADGLKNNSTNYATTTDVDTQWGMENLLVDIIDPDGIPEEIIANATRYAITLTIPADLMTLDGTLRVLYTNRETKVLEDIYFRLPPNSAGGAIEVTDINADDTDCESELVSHGSALRLRLPKPLAVGEKTAIRMVFQLHVPTEMGGNYGLFGYFVGILALDVFFPIIPVYNEQGWNVEEPPSNGDQIFTDVAFFDVNVTAPKDLVLVASGKAVEDSVESTTRQTRFVGGPMRDFFLAGSTNLKTLSAQVNGITIRSSFPADFEQAGKYALETARRAMQIYSTRLGVYPYTEFDIVATPMLAGGMEYSGATSVSTAWYDFSKKVSGTSAQSVLESVVAHELAHQWFFNQLMNNQLQEPWLDEAWAQYATYLYFLDWSGRTGSEQYFRTWQARLARARMPNTPIGLAAGEYADGAEYSAIIYGRGPIFLSVLAETMGQEKFSEFTRAYVDMYQWEVVDSQTFKELAEDFCSCNLDGLFAEWVFVQK